MSETVDRPTPDPVSEQIRAFIREHFPLARQNPPADDDSLLDSGIVDSLGILEIVNFLMSAFGVEISDDDLQPENFDSIESLRRFILGRRGAA